MMKFSHLICMLSFCIFFSACGDKKVELKAGGTSEIISSEQTANQPEEIIQEYVPVKKPLQNDELKTIYFTYDSFMLSKEAFIIVNQNAELLKQYPDVRVVLEGNTDAYGSGEYNFALGNKRALAVKEALLVRGITQDRIEVVSFGEAKPACTENNSAECRQKNRRVDFVLKTK